MTSDARARRSSFAVTAAMAALSLASVTQAATSYWDTNESTIGAGGSAPDGTWGIDHYWSSAPDGDAATGAWSAGDIAVFSAGVDATGSYAIAVDGTQTADGIIFEDGLDVLLSSGQINLTGLATVQVVNASATMLSKLGGSAGLNKLGPGLLAMASTSPNTNTGLHAITAGTLRLQGTNQIADTAAVSVSNGATFDLNGHQEAVGALSGGGSIALGSASLTTNGSGNFTGAISGAGGLTKTGNNTLVLGGTNTYSGLTRVNGGILSISSTDNLGDGSTSNNLSFNAGTLLTTAGITTSRTITLTGAGTINVPGGESSIFNGAISGNASLVKSGAGTLVLSGANSNTNTVQITAGTLAITNASGLGTVGTGSGTTVASGATFALGEGLSVPESFAAISGQGVGNGGAIRKTGAADSTINGTITVSSGANPRINSDGGTLTLNGAVFMGAAAGTSITYGGAGNIRINANPAALGTNGGNKLYKDGPGTLTLAASSSHDGGTVINGGLLSIDIDSRLGAVPASPVANQVVIDGGALRSATTIVDIAAPSYTAFNANRGIGIGTTGTIDITPVTASSIIAIYSGTIGKLSTLAENADAQLIKTGPNELRYNGNTRAATGFTKLKVVQGLFRLGDVPGFNTELGFGVAPSSSKADAITLDSGGAIGVSFNATLHANRGITLGTNGPGGVLNGIAGTMAIPGVISGGTLNAVGGSLVSGGVIITGNNTHARTVIGSDNLTLRGGISPTTAGALTINGDAALGAVPIIPQPDNVLLGTATAAGLLALNEDANLHANRGITVGAGGGTIFVAAGKTVTYAGDLGGTGNFTKSGTGTLVFGGESTNSGATTMLFEGTLVVAHPATLGSGNLSIASFATARAELDLATAVSVAAIETVGSGTFDLSNNSMVIKGSNLSDVAALIQQGYNDGNWLGGGIRSSVAAHDPNSLTAIGFADNGDQAASEFEGVTGLDANDVLVKCTTYGDADLNDSVDLDDFNLFLAGYQNPNNVSQTWLYGDFDFSGSVDLDDFNLFLGGYQAAGSSLSALAYASEMSGIPGENQQFMLNAIAAVPEPGHAGVLALAAAGLTLFGQRRSCHQA
jgi:autotransporter-associated beta strand protein